MRVACAAVPARWRHDRTGLTVTQLYSVEGFREEARRRLPRAVFDFVDGGAEDEVTVQANRDAFTALKLCPRIHENERAIELSTTVCGQHMAIPILLAPVGCSSLFHAAGCAVAARAAAERGTTLIMSAASGHTIEEVAAAADPKPWYQVYPFESREFYGGLLDRAAQAGYRGIAVTVDTPVGSKRERDIKNGFALPPRLTARNAIEIARHPRWTAGVVRHRRVVVKALASPAPLTLRSLVKQANAAAGRVNRSMVRVTWDELAWIRERWTGPLAVKGILHPADAERAADLGADAVIVSNHGGRQLDGALASLDALPAVTDAVGDRIDVLLDGGIRRGSDVVKALCLGARAVLVGRPWIYGLATAGGAGVAAVLDVLRAELTVTLTLLGQTDLNHLNTSLLARAS